MKFNRPKLRKWEKQHLEKPFKNFESETKNI